MFTSLPLICFTILICLCITISPDLDGNRGTKEKRAPDSNSKTPISLKRSQRRQKKMCPERPMPLRSHDRPSVWWFDQKVRWKKARKIEDPKFEQTLRGRRAKRANNFPLLREGRGHTADPKIMSHRMLALPLLGVLLSATLCGARTVGLARPQFGALKLNSAGQLRNNVQHDAFFGDRESDDDVGMTSINWGEVWSQPGHRIAGKLLKAACKGIMSKRNRSMSPPCMEEELGESSSDESEMLPQQHMAMAGVSLSAPCQCPSFIAAQEDRGEEPKSRHHGGRGVQLSSAAAGARHSARHASRRDPPPPRRARYRRRAPVAADEIDLYSAR